MNVLDLYIEQERIYCLEGYEGVRKFEKIVKVLGYDNLTSFLADNSGCLEAMMGFVHDWTSRNTEWEESIQGELFNSEEEDEYRDDPADDVRELSVGD